MKFGILNARKNASVASSAPKYRAMTISRTNPETLETRVDNPTVKVDFKSFK
jgi:hypothetical protein